MASVRAAGEPAAKRARQQDEPTLVNAHFVVTLHLVNASQTDKLAQEIRAGGVGESFKAEFLHQHFGDEEQIKGFRGLTIDIWFHATTFHAWVDVKYEKRRAGADKLDAVFKEKFPSGYFKEEEAFVAAAAAEATALPHLAGVGQRLGAPLALSSSTADPAWESVAAAGEEVAIQHFKLASAPQAIKDLHGRLEALLLFFIDGADFIDADDPQWELMLAVPTRSKVNCVLGMATMYDFWAYPDSRRVRVSQVLVLPPFQGRQLGKRLLQAAYGIAQQRGVLDLTVEDPTPNLQRVREKLEAEMMLEVDWIRQAAARTAETLGQGKPPSAPTTPAEPSPVATRGLHAAAGGGGPDASPVAAPHRHGGGGGSGSSGRSEGGDLSPSLSLVSRVTKELKIYRAEVRNVWEILLYLQPSLTKEGSLGFALLAQLVRKRLEAAPHFAASCTTAAEGKVVVHSHSDVRVFTMMRARKGQLAAPDDAPNEALPAGAVPATANLVPLAESATAAAVAGQGDDTAGARNEWDVGGRFNPAQLDPAERKSKLAELLEERLAGLQLTARLLAKSKHVAPV